MLDTKAFSEVAMAAVLKYIEAQTPSPSRSRIRFILRFVEAVGLRSAELLEAKLKDFRLEPEGWVIQVFGKGAKNRVAAVPGQAFAALQVYLMSRHLDGIETVPGTLPLLASTTDPFAPIGYQALYEHVRGWFRKAIANSGLPSTERAKLARASTHWLEAYLWHAGGRAGGAAGCDSGPDGACEYYDDDGHLWAGSDQTTGGRAGQGVWPAAQFTRTPGCWRPRTVRTFLGCCTVQHPYFFASRLSTAERKLAYSASPSAPPFKDRLIDPSDFLVNFPTTFPFCLRSRVTGLTGFG